MKEQERGIQIIGHIGHGENAVVQELKNKEIDIIMLDESHSHDESFELNGVRYEPIKTEQKYNKAIGSIMIPIYEYGESQYERKLPEGTDIVKEYGLIQNKQSKLPKWERDVVVKKFEETYKII